MGKSIGAIRALSLSNRKWRIPADVDLTFWPGGRHNSEWQDDNIGGTPVNKNTTGKITGLTTRMAKNNELASMIEVVKDTVDDAVACTVELANGDKWSAPVRCVIDEGGPFTSAEGKFSLDLYADNDTGEFVQI